MDYSTNPHVPFYDSFYIAEFISDLKVTFVYEIIYIGIPFFAHVSHDAFLWDLSFESHMAHGKSSEDLKIKLA